MLRGVVEPRVVGHKALLGCQRQNLCLGEHKVPHNVLPLVLLSFDNPVVNRPVRLPKVLCGFTSQPSANRRHLRLR